MPTRHFCHDDKIVKQRKNILNINFNVCMLPPSKHASTSFPYNPFFSCICAVSLISLPLLLFIVVNIRVKSFKDETNISNWQPNVGWWQQLLFLLFFAWYHSAILTLFHIANKALSMSIKFTTFQSCFFIWVLHFLPASLSSMCVLRKQKRKFDGKV